MARFVQADPFIQASTNVQSFNRYSYVYNNPLNKTDPSGYFVKDLVRGVMRMIGPEASSVLIGVGSMFCGPAAPICAAAGSYDLARAYGASSSQALMSAGMAGISSAVFMGMSGVESVGTRFAVSGLVGGVFSELSGGSFGRGFAAGAVGSLAGGKGGFSKMGAVRSAVVGGTVSYISGGKFGNGAVTGAFSYVMSWGVEKYKAGGGAST